MSRYNLPAYVVNDCVRRIDQNREFRAACAAVALRSAPLDSLLAFGCSPVTARWCMSFLYGDHAEWA